MSGASFCTLWARDIGLLLVGFIYQSAKFNMQ
jgi:hypothetical protein